MLLSELHRIAGIDEDQRRTLLLPSANSFGSDDQNPGFNLGRRDRRR
jgi:hypothetical protein